MYLNTILVFLFLNITFNYMLCLLILFNNFLKSEWNLFSHKWVCFYNIYIAIINDIFKYVNTNTEGFEDWNYKNVMRNICKHISLIKSLQWYTTSVIVLFLNWLYYDVVHVQCLSNCSSVVCMYCFIRVCSSQALWSQSISWSVTNPDVSQLLHSITYDALIYVLYLFTMTTPS